MLCRVCPVLSYDCRASAVEIINIITLFPFTTIIAGWPPHALCRQLQATVFLPNGRHHGDSHGS